MSNRHNIRTGRLGEQLAVEWLIENGYRILHRNWRFGRLEIDVVAQKNGMLHCIEVKTRNNSTYGCPEESITKSKYRSLVAASQKLLEAEGFDEVQVDVLAIAIRHRIQEYFLIEDIGCGSL